MIMDSNDLQLIVTDIYDRGGVVRLLNSAGEETWSHVADIWDEDGEAWHQALTDQLAESGIEITGDWTDCGAVEDIETGTWTVGETGSDIVATATLKDSFDFSDLAAPDQSERVEGTTDVVRLGRHVWLQEEWSNSGTFHTVHETAEEAIEGFEQDILIARTSIVAGATAGWTFDCDRRDPGSRFVAGVERGETLLEAAETSGMTRVDDLAEAMQEQGFSDEQIFETRSCGDYDAIKIDGDRWLAYDLDWLLDNLRECGIQPQSAAA